jgi:polyferredoxin
MKQANLSEPLPILDSSRAFTNCTSYRAKPQAIPRWITVARLRTTIQAGFALFCAFAGYRFYHFYSWAVGNSDVYVARPPAVESFLPISALLGLKRLVLTGQWDEVHPAGLAVFLGACALALTLRKSFCGWICPVGFASNFTAKLGKALRWGHELPRWLEYPLLGIKYLLLAFFGYIILWRMDVRMIEAFLYSQYNLVVDVRMLLFFLHPSLLTLKILGILVIVSLVLQNFWCRYLCPYGALLGLGALLSPVQIKRDSSLCVHCARCDKVCPAGILISNNRTVRHPECVGCAECVEACPKKGCLSLKTFGSATIPVYVFPALVLGVFLLFWAGAVISGHWHSAVPVEVFRQFYPSASTVAHP